jgi:hypothetical protein
MVHPQPACFAGLRRETEDNLRRGKGKKCAKSLVILQIRDILQKSALRGAWADNGDPEPAKSSVK